MGNNRQVFGEKQKIPSVEIQQLIGKRKSRNAIENLLSTGKRAHFLPADFPLEKLAHDPKIRLLRVVRIADRGVSRHPLADFLAGFNVVARESCLQKYYF